VQGRRGDYGEGDPGGRQHDGPVRRWESGFYLDRPEEWDDPYRFFRW
jgi:hypothetical protein